MFTSFDSLSVSSLFNSAKEELRGKWRQMATIMFLLLVFSYGIGLLLGAIHVILKLIPDIDKDILDDINPYIFRVFYFLITAPLGIGFCKLSLNLLRQEEIKFATVFWGFRLYFKILLVNIITSILFVAGLICFIVPGFYVLCAYSQILFILSDNPEISILQAMKQSKKLMTGYFCKYLPVFTVVILLTIASIITLGIAGLWLTPLSATITAIFYERLRYLKQSEA